MRVLSGSALRTVPGGQVLGVLSRNLDAQVESEQGSSVRLRVVGFVNATELQVDPTGARATVTGAAGATIRMGFTEKDPALAELRKGTVVFPSQKTANFVAVTRPVWVDKSRLTKFTTPAAAPSVAATTAATSPGTSSSSAGSPSALSKTVTSAQAGGIGASSTPGGPTMTVSASSTLRAAPDGDAVASLRQGATLSTLATENGWTRVRLEGWVPSRELTSSAGRDPGALSAADIRADPDGTRGKVVHWEVEALSYQLADGLRRELNGEPYILALGPGKERAILYLAVPDSLISRARALSPLTLVNVTVRVRSGRSQPGGIPILDLIELSRK